ncbi:hypothetical protein RASY3_02885 [Ruminococcus albus SY3]|uniref:DUF2971 domain-containing protein n=1 Tax=Ruminococcus albus SY3 TaxID=1341156 RepID=A0A011W2K8_RUMAL|nr:DUF2971 domain-containing protein [Ruminococcus albus]EXM41028.1 hypothetical protein RASY3_02885 [Ruminococcus albus SY3]
MSTQLLFKYKPINSTDQLVRIIDSINNNRLFFPGYKKLNDPLESSGYVIELSGYAGRGMILAVDDEDRFVAERRQQYKILSLTENCFSPSMWAHYTSEYNGICIGYWRKESFSSARKLTYINEAVHAKTANYMGFVDEDNLDQEVYESFFYKHSDWSYEKEWRIVSKQDDKFLNYSSNDLACIIFGENLSNEIRSIIINNLKVHVPMYYTKTGYRSFGINLLPISYVLNIDGSTPPFIRNADELIDDINKKTC